MGNKLQAELEHASIFFAVENKLIDSSHPFLRKEIVHEALEFNWCHGLMSWGKYNAWDAEIYKYTLKMDDIYMAHTIY